jgi:hypothetical protein
MMQAFDITAPRRPLGRTKPVLVGALILGLATCLLAATARAQSNAPASSLRSGAPKSLVPFADLFPARSVGSTVAPRKLLPYIKLSTNRDDGENKTIGSVKRAASEEAADSSPFNRSAGKAYKIDDQPVVAAPTPARQKSVDVAERLARHGEVQASHESKPRNALRKISLPATLRISDDDEMGSQSAPIASKGATASISDSSLWPEPPADPVGVTDREALSALVQFGPARSAREPSAVRARPALIQKAQPNNLRVVKAPSDEAGGELLQVPVPPSEAEGAPPGEPGQLPEEVKSEFKSISSLGVNIGTEEGRFPDDIAAGRFKGAGELYQSLGYRREWAASSYAWVAPGLCHNPLYFEEINLERHGHSFGLVQPGVSFLNFYGRLILLPYLMGATPPRECVYTLGYYRPGSYAPFQLHRPPLSAKGALYEAAAITGAYLIFP